MHCSLALVPHPRDPVYSANDYIKAGDCGSQFLSALTERSKTIVERLQSKKLLSGCLDGNSLAEFLNEIVNHLNLSEKDHGMALAHTAMLKLSFERAQAKARDHFELARAELAKAFGHVPLNPTEFDGKIMEILAQAMEILESNMKFGKDEDKRPIIELLSVQLKSKAQELMRSNKDDFDKQIIYNASNGAIDKYQKAMSALDVCLNLDEDIIKKHENSKKQAIEFFNAAVESVTQNEEVVMERARLGQDLESRLKDHQLAKVQRDLPGNLEKFRKVLIHEYSMALNKAMPNIVDLKGIDHAIQVARRQLKEKFLLSKTEFLYKIRTQSGGTYSVDFLDQIVTPQLEIEAELCEEDQRVIERAQCRFEVNHLNQKIEDQQKAHETHIEQQNVLKAELQSQIEGPQTQLEERNKERNDDQRQTMIELMSHIGSSRKAELEAARISQERCSEKFRRSIDLEGSNQGIHFPVLQQNNQYLHQLELEDRQETKEMEKKARHDQLETAKVLNEMRVAEKQANDEVLWMQQEIEPGNNNDMIKNLTQVASTVSTIATAVVQFSKYFPK